MRYEELLTIQDALLNALSQLQLCQFYREMTEKYLSRSTAIPPASSLTPVIEQTREAYHQVGYAVFEYELEQNASIAANDLNHEDVPF